MSFTIAGALQESDLLDAYRLRDRSLLVKRTLLVVGFALAIALLIEGLDNGFDDPRRVTIYLIAMAVFGLIVAAILPVVSHFLILPRYAKKIYRQQSDLRHENTIEWDNTVITMSSEAGSYRTQLGDFVKWTANDKVLLLYRADNLFNMLPSHFFQTPDRRADLIAKLEAAGVPGRHF